LAAKENEAKERPPTTLAFGFPHSAFACGGSKNSLRSDSLDPSSTVKHSVRPRCMGFETLKKTKIRKAQTKKHENKYNYKQLRTLTFVCYP